MEEEQGGSNHTKHGLGLLKRRDGDLQIDVIRSQRKTVSIFIERDGSVCARVPKQITEEELQDVIKSQEYQIYKHLSEWSIMNSSKVERQYVSGQSFLYLGKNYRLKLVDEDLSGVMLKNGYFIISRKDLEQAEKLFIQFYKNKLIKKITPLIEAYQKQLGVAPNGITVMELQHRWASCSSKKNLNFHWKCGMLPYDIISYVVAHELVHLIHPNHTPQFWNELDKVMPNYESKKAWLKLNGAGVSL